MSTETDDRGRLYLPKKVREHQGERFRIVPLPSHIALFPVDEDPLQAVHDAIGDRFEGKSVAELKQEALGAVSEEVAADIEARERRQDGEEGA